MKNETKEYLRIKAEKKYRMKKCRMDGKKAQKMEKEKIYNLIDSVRLDERRNRKNNIEKENSLKRNKNRMILTENRTNMVKSV